MVEKQPMLRSLYTTSFVRGYVMNDGNFQETVARYIRHWSKEEFSEREFQQPYRWCSVCFVLLNTKKIEPVVQNGFRLFALRLPSTMFSVLLLWYHIKHILKLTIDEALSMAPEDVYSQYFLGTCPNDTPTAQAQLNKFHTFTINLMHFLQEDITPRQVHPNKKRRLHHSNSDDDESEEEQSAKDANKRSEDMATKLKKQFQALIKSDQMKGGCHGFITEIESRCIYSNTGMLKTANTDQMMLDDGRALVSPEWITKYTNTEVRDFWNPTTCRLHGHPGVFRESNPQYVVDASIDTNEIQNVYRKTKPPSGYHYVGDYNWFEEMCGDETMTLTKTTTKTSVTTLQRAAQYDKSSSRQGTQTFKPGTFSNATLSLTLLSNDIEQRTVAQSCNIDQEERSEFQTTYKKHTCQFLNDLLHFEDIHNKIVVPAVADDKSIRFGLISLLTKGKPCFYCDMLLYTNFRYILVDLLVMARMNTEQTGFDNRYLSGQLFAGSPTCPVAEGKSMTADEKQNQVMQNIRSDADKRAKYRSRKPCNQSSKRLVDNTIQPKEERDVTNATYSFPYAKSSMNAVPLFIMFPEWLEKYPFMTSWMERNCVTKEDLVHAVLKHFTLAGDIICSCNVRRITSEADCHMVQNHFCNIDFMAFALNCLKNSLTISERNYLVKTIGQHHLPSSLSE